MGTKYVYLLAVILEDVTCAIQRLVIYENTPLQLYNNSLIRNCENGIVFPMYELSDVTSDGIYRFSTVIILLQKNDLSETCGHELAFSK